LAVELYRKRRRPATIRGGRLSVSATNINKTRDKRNQTFSKSIAAVDRLVSSFFKRTNHRRGNRRRLGRESFALTGRWLRPGVAGQWGHGHMTLSSSGAPPPRRLLGPPPGPRWRRPGAAPSLWSDSHHFGPSRSSRTPETTNQINRKSTWSAGSLPDQQEVHLVSRKST